jgi:glucose/arabinose dehydrogenase
LRLTEVASGFGQPVFVDAPAGDDRLFIVDQPGAIELVSAGERLGTFLDVRDRVSFGGEQGLLGLAFHPGYPADPRFYVHYTALDGAGIIAEYRVSDDPTRADPASERVLLRVPQPAANHNGGMLAFGPDGHLYIALGDGGGANDRFGHGQNRETVLGAILRVDVDGDPYAIPAANPFADGGGAPEIWAFGLRNPWRFSFDGDLAYIADVGQNAWEEINVVDHRTAGPNFGWPVLEASTCFAAAGCEREGFESPVFEYPHRDGACSVTGGYVYRGATIPELAGAYFFGDFCSGAVTAFRLGGTEISELRDWPDLTAPGLTSFGTDGAGELYLTTTAGSVFRIDRG